MVYMHAMRKRTGVQLYKLMVFFILVIVVSGLLVGCGFSLPILNPDDVSVSKRFLEGLKSIDDVSGGVDIEYERSFGNDKVSRHMSGRFAGNVSEKMGFDLSVDDESYKGVVDIGNQILYMQQDDQDWVAYSDAMSVIDPEWWIDICSNRLGYAGKKEDSNGRSGYELSNSFTGEDSGKLLAHLHIPFIGENDASSSDIIISVIIDKLSGKPYEAQIRSSKSGNPISVFEEDGTEWQVDNFVLTITFSYKGIQSFSIPDEALKVTPIEPGSDLVVTEDESDSGSNHDSDEYIMSGDKNWKAGFSGHSIFDSVESVKGTRLDIQASEYTAGNPIISMKFVSGLDAYNSADSDASIALKYYAKQSALTDIYVSENILASSIAGCPAYSYIQQYTEKELGFVNSEYCTYVELTDELSLYIKISSMVDPGVSTVLTESYAQSVLENVWVESIGADNKTSDAIQSDLNGGDME